MTTNMVTLACDTLAQGGAALSWNRRNSWPRAAVTERKPAVSASRFRRLYNALERFTVAVAFCATKWDPRKPLGLFTILNAMTTRQ